MSRDLGEPLTRGGPGSGKPQQAVLALMSGYWAYRDNPMPTATIVRLMAEFGYSSSNSRVALSRLLRRGLVGSVRIGRQSYYSPTREAELMLAGETERITSFGTEERDWSGDWIIVTFSIPESARAMRDALRGRLRSLGFAPLQDAVWASPWDDEEQLRATLTEIGIANAAIIIRGRISEGAPAQGDLVRVWDLDGQTARYLAFIETWISFRELVRAGQVQPSEALLARARLLLGWRTFALRDPILPKQLLPENFPRSRAREVFQQLSDELGPLAAQRVRQLTELDAPELTRYVDYRPFPFETLGVAQQTATVTNGPVFKRHG